MIQKSVFSKRLFLLIFISSFLIFLIHTYFTKTAIFADGRFYYATTRSIVKDFDINFANDFPNLNVTPTKTTTGYTWNKYPPGSSIAWMPLFFITDGLSSIFEIGGISTDTQGFGIFYQSSIAISSIFLSVLALILIFKLLKDYFPQKISYLTTLTLFATTNLLFYIAVEPINSHAVSFFVSTLFVFYLIRYKKEKYYYFILGIMGGFAGLVRTQDLLIMTLPAIDIFLNNKKQLKKLAGKYLLLFGGCLIGFLPQIYFWRKIFGTYWFSPYFNEGFSFSFSEILNTLFNKLNGLFYITPTIAISLIGPLLIWKNMKNRNLNLISTYALIYFLIQLLLVTFWQPSIGGSFSNRMMITTYPLLSFGLARIIKLASDKFSWKNVILLVLIFVLNNSVQIIKYLLLY